MIKRIYFVDGELSIGAIKDMINQNMPYKSYYKIVDGEHGISNCLSFADEYKSDKAREYDIITNCVNLLSYHYSKNLYIRTQNGVYTNVRDLTDKDLKPAHNINKMYIAGSFGKFTNI